MGLILEEEEPVFVLAVDITLDLDGAGVDLLRLIEVLQDTLLFQLLGTDVYKRQTLSCPPWVFVSRKLPSRCQKPLPLGEVASPAMPERASRLTNCIPYCDKQALCPSDVFLFPDILALSGAHAPALPKGEPLRIG